MMEAPDDTTRETPTVPETSPLLKEWLDLLRPYRCKEALEQETFAELVRRYGEPHRYYHNLDHVAAMLELVKSACDQLHDSDAVRFAVWFHDTVYDTTRSDNEAESAALARAMLTDIGVPVERIDNAVSLILMTRTHEADARLPDSAVFVDADLAILGADPETYARYADAIRREYAWVPEDRYRAGRAQVLRKFLARPRIYFTEEMHLAREEQARRNMEEEIHRLA
jgi:predicted metal-dependent HD superfamily phosphohydrolase